MKTLLALRITTVLNSIFCFFCIASTVCFAIDHYYNFQGFFSAGIILTNGWIINPIGILSFIVCFHFYSTERKNQEAKSAMGKKWIWVFIWPVVTTVFYLTASGLMVAFTGGV